MGSRLVRLRLELGGKDPTCVCHDAFLAVFVDIVKGFWTVDPMRENTDIGAITRAPQLDLVRALASVVTLAPASR